MPLSPPPDPNCHPQGQRTDPNLANREPAPIIRPSHPSHIHTDGAGCRRVRRRGCLADLAVDVQEPAEAPLTWLWTSRSLQGLMAEEQEKVLAEREVWGNDEGFVGGMRVGPQASVNIYL